MLDFKMPGMDTPEGQGLLAAAFSLLQARKMPGDRGIGGALGAAGQQYMGTRSQAQDQMQRRKLLDAQMAAQQAEVEQRQAAVKRQAALDAEAARKAQEAERIRGLVANAGSVRLGMGAGLPDGLLPPELSTGQTFPALQQPGQIDYQSLFQQGVPLEMLKGLAEAPNLGKSKVKNIETVSIDGKPMRVGIDEYGQKVAQIGMEWKPLQFQDFGGDVRAFDPANPEGGFRKMGDKSMTFGDKIAQGQLGVSRENLKLAQDRLRFDRGGGAEGAKPQVIDGHFVYRPDANNPQGRAVPIAGLNPKPPQAFSDRVSKLNDLEGALADYKASIAENKGMLWGTGAMPKHIPIPFTEKGFPLPQGTTTTDLSAKYTTMMMGLKDLYTLGALAGPDMAVLQGNLQDPATFKGFLTSKGSFEKQVEVVEGMLERAKKNLSTAYGNREIPEAAKPTPAIPPAAINDLKMRKGDPRAIAQFDEVFGPGAAEKALKGK